MSRNDDTTVRFSGLKSGSYNYDFTLNRAFFEGFENDEILDGEVQIEAKMERFEHMLMFHFGIKGQVIVACDRCLGEMPIAIEGEESLCVRFSDSETSEDENVVVMPENAFEIDLAQWLYEYVAVRIPMQHMHEEGDCDPAMVSLLANEGEKAQEEAIDPRWEALKNLK